jgi:hypothetical protein
VSIQDIISDILSNIAAQPRFVVELHPGVWLAPWKGDPGRTLVLESARRFSSRHGAATALGIAKRHRPLPFAQIVELPL